MRTRFISIDFLLGALTTGCDELVGITVPTVAHPAAQEVALEGLRFFLPSGMNFDGSSTDCPYRASECPVGDDTVYLAWTAKNFRLDYILDFFGSPPDDDWGDPFTLNDRPAFRKTLPGGAKRYLITKHYDGKDSAAVALCQQQEKPILWKTCECDSACDLVLQTMASVKTRSAEEECRLLLPGDTAPPPPPQPRPLDARSLCEEYSNE